MVSLKGRNLKVFCGWNLRAGLKNKKRFPTQVASKCKVWKIWVRSEHNLGVFFSWDTTHNILQPPSRPTQNVPLVFQNYSSQRYSAEKVIPTQFTWGASLAAAASGSWKIKDLRRVREGPGRNMAWGSKFPFGPTDWFISCIICSWSVTQCLMLTAWFSSMDWWEIYREPWIFDGFSHIIWPV